MYWTDAFWLLGSASAEPVNNKLASPDRLTEFRSFRRAAPCPRLPHTAHIQKYH
jgi:hypothetical protein